MSVVAWDGKTLAADRQGTHCGLRQRATKLKRLYDGTLIAWVGQLDTGLILFDWYERGADLNCWPESQRHDDHSSYLIVARLGAIVTYGQYPMSQPVEEPFWAWGSGRDYALGALAMGADARTAVEIASRFNVDCGFGVDAFDLEGEIHLAKTGD